MMWCEYTIIKFMKEEIDKKKNVIFIYSWYTTDHRIHTMVDDMIEVEKRQMVMLIGI